MLALVMETENVTEFLKSEILELVGVAVAAHIFCVNHCFFFVNDIRLV